MYGNRWRTLADAVRYEVLDGLLQAIIACALRDGRHELSVCRELNRLHYRSLSLLHFAWKRRKSQEDTILEWYQR